MAFTNTDDLEAAIIDFQELEIDDRLLLLALVYQQVVNSIPLDNWGNIAQTNAYILVQQIQELTLEEQLTFLSEALFKEEGRQDELLLDVDREPTITNLYPTQQYRLLNSESKLAVWYLTAENLAEIISDIPSEYTPTPVAMELFNFLQTLNHNRLVFFLKQIL